MSAFTVRLAALRIAGRLLAAGLLLVAGLLAGAWLALPAAAASPGNRLAYLDEPCDPYYVHGDFPRLTTPQWVGEPGVEAVVVLAIDDMRDPAPYEAFLRPILNRLKQIDGRAPVSIMTNRADPADPRLQDWLREGLSIDVHTYDHPCPCLQNGDFASAKRTYEQCVDLMASIPGNRPAAFRMPCCDSKNTPSPRFWAEIFNRATAAGNYLSIDSSVFQVFTSADAALPRELVLDEQGNERFRRYIPFPSFVNTIENYPYPYVIGRLCWQFPCMVPSDWEAQYVQKPNNPKTVEDLKRALDATVIKQGVFNLVFHPHGWIRNDQVVALIDHAVARHGSKVKFLNFREALDRLNTHLLAGQPLRGADGRDNGVRILDVNNDGWQDVVIANDSERKTRLWRPEEQTWQETEFPWPIVSRQRNDAVLTRFGVLSKEGAAWAIYAAGDSEGTARFADGAWRPAVSTLPEGAATAEFDQQVGAWRDSGLRLRDLDGDGVCELLQGNAALSFVRRWNGATPGWDGAAFSLPEGTSIVDAAGGDAGLRWTDVNRDGRDDLLFSNDERFGVWLFDSMESGFVRAIAGGRSDPGALPRIVRQGTNNGAWIHSDHLWVQNEDTARLPDGVDRASLGQLRQTIAHRQALARQPAIAVGAASKDITPEYPVRLSGYGNRRDESAGVAQRIFAKAIAIGADDSADGPAVVISFENCSVPPGVREALVARLAKETRVRSERLLLCCTHSHTAPLLSGMTTFLFPDPLPDEHQAHVDRYTSELVDKLFQAAAEALANRRPARLSWAKGTVGFAANRRVLREGKWTGFGVQPDGPVDHRLSLLKAEGEDGKPIALWVNYACHCTTLGGDFNQIAGDWAGFAQQLIEAANPGAVALISIGCGADANPEPRGGMEVCEKHGQSVAAEVARLMAAPEGFAPLAHDLDCRLTQADLPLETPPTADEWRERAKEGGQLGHLARHFLAKLERGEELHRTVPEPVAVWTFGEELAMVFLGGEVVVDYAIRMYDEFLGERLWITAYANATPGYIPTQRILREGGYEADTSQIFYGHPTRYAPQVEELLMDTVQRLLPRTFYGPKKQAEFPPPKSPEEAQASIRVRPGFKVDLVASEPLIADPVAFDWGPDGRLWVAEMADYPLGVDPPDRPGAVGRPGGRIKQLFDDDGDGRYDRAELFLDDVPYPTGVKAWREGVIVVAAPAILFAADTDGDGKADLRKTLYEGFAEGNQQHRVNGARYGLDHWLYLANGDSDGEVTSLATGQTVSIRGRDVRIQPDTGALETESGRTQFGRNRDDWGNWFGGNNSDPMWHYVLEDRYLRRNPHVSSGDVRVQTPAVPGAAPVFPISKTLARFNDHDRADRFTSACSPIIYRDDLFGPEFLGASFVCEPVHNLVHREVVVRQGVTFASRRADDEQQSEFFASSDNWCRPVMCRTGPDGALWIADMYRAVIEHPEWIPGDWQRRLDLRAGEDRGRIYRVYPADAPPRKFQDLSGLSAEQLAEALDSPNGWRRDMAQQMLIWKQDASAVQTLESIARGRLRAQARLHALYSLDGLGRLSEELLLAALADAHAEVRRHAVRLCESRLNDSPALGEALARMAADKDPALALQLACSLGEWRSPQVGRLLAGIARRHAENRFVLAAVMSSIREESAGAYIAGLLDEAENQPPPAALVEQALRMCAGFASQAPLIEALGDVAAGSEQPPPAWKLSAVAGALEGLARRDGGAAAAEKAISPQFLSAVRMVAADTQASEEARLPAMRILGRLPAPQDSDLETLLAGLSPQNSSPVQQAAVASLVRIGSPVAIAKIVDRWASLTPAVRGQAIDELLAHEATSELLLESLESGRISAGEFDARRREQLVRHGAGEIRQRAEKLFAAAGNPSRQQVLEAYAAVASLPGDAGLGKAVFEKRCANCHRLEGAGHEVGPDLAALTDKSIGALLTAVLDPNRAVENKFIDYAAVTEDGRVHRGLLWSESGAGVTLRAAEGKELALARAEIVELRSTGKSLMPEGLEKDIPQEDMAHLLAYLRRQSPPARQFAGNSPAVVTPDSDGRIHLKATHCRIYGPTLVFEQLYGNLGWWQSADDHAIWRLTAPATGKYRAALVYACQDESAGGEFVLEAGGQKLTGKIRGTGSWDQYERIEIGELRLAAGEQELAVRSAEPPASPLMDLREIVLTPLSGE